MGRMNGKEAACTHSAVPYGEQSSSADSAIPPVAVATFSSARVKRVAFHLDLPENVLQPISVKCRLAQQPALEARQDKAILYRRMKTRLASVRSSSELAPVRFKRAGASLCRGSLRCFAEQADVLAKCTKQRSAVRGGWGLLVRDVHVPRLPVLGVSSARPGSWMVAAHNPPPLPKGPGSLRFMSWYEGLCTCNLSEAS